VVYEVRDRILIGDLRAQSLTDLWQGPAMRAFRAAYLAGAAPSCRGCPYKRVAFPVPFTRRVRPGVSSQQLLFGWYPAAGGASQAKPSSAQRLAGPRASRLALRGQLPGGAGWTNTLTVSINGAVIGEVANGSGASEPFDVALPLGAAAGRSEVVVHFHVARPLVPAASGQSPDAHRLGFALFEAALR
jgi:hypothetical protein